MRDNCWEAGSGELRTKVIIGKDFGSEVYANGETIFRQVEAIEKGEKIKFSCEGLKVTEGLLPLCIGILYAKDHGCNIIFEDESVDWPNVIKSYIKFVMWGIGYRAGLHQKDVNKFDYYYDGNETFVALIKYTTKVDSTKDSSLNMYYIPYSRMDRAVDNKIFAFKYFAQLINMLGFKEVNTFDPHNDTCNLIKNLNIINGRDFIQSAIQDFKPDVIMYPDCGAFNKYKATYGSFKDHNGNEIPETYALKMRDPKDSRIKGYWFSQNDVELKDKKVLIIDDILSTGLTIRKALQNLGRHGIGDFALCISHLENPSVLDDVETYTTNSMSGRYTLNESSTKIHMYNLQTEQVKFEVGDILWDNSKTSYYIVESIKSDGVVIRSLNGMPFDDKHKFIDLKCMNMYTKATWVDDGNGLCKNVKTGDPVKLTNRDYFGEYEFTGAVEVDCCNNLICLLKYTVGPLVREQASNIKQRKPFNAHTSLEDSIDCKLDSMITCINDSDDCSKWLLEEHIKYLRADIRKWKNSNTGSND